MRLLYVHTFGVTEFHGEANTPPYGILSHTWGKEEVTYHDILNLKSAMKKTGFSKIARTVEPARRDRLDWIWVDTCCIDKSSSAELQEAINSMYRWYAMARVCYAYLEDVMVAGIAANGPSASKTVAEIVSGSHMFASSRWFRRGWTLQELLAPPSLTFYSKEWLAIGTKADLCDELAVITGIDRGILMNREKLSKMSIAKRMSWAANRKTTRIEDQAYCLLGIFGVNIPMLYGEGERAFLRLQQEIIRVSNDQSIFAWDFDNPHAVDASLLADSPARFARFRDVQPWGNPGQYEMTNRGLRINLPIVEESSVMPRTGQKKCFVGLLHCRYEDDFFSTIALRLEEGDSDDHFVVNTAPTDLVVNTVPAPGDPPLLKLADVTREGRRKRLGHFPNRPDRRKVGYRLTSFEAYEHAVVSTGYIALTRDTDHDSAPFVCVRLHQYGSTVQDSAAISWLAPKESWNPETGIMRPSALDEDDVVAGVVCIKIRSASVLRIRQIHFAYSFEAMTEYSSFPHYSYHAPPEHAGALSNMPRVTQLTIVAEDDASDPGILTRPRRRHLARLSDQIIDKDNAIVSESWITERGSSWIQAQMRLTKIMGGHVFLLDIQISHPGIELEHPSSAEQPYTGFRLYDPPLPGEATSESSTDSAEASALNMYFAAWHIAKELDEAYGLFCGPESESHASEEASADTKGGRPKERGLSVDSKVDIDDHVLPSLGDDIDQRSIDEDANSNDDAVSAVDSQLAGSGTSTLLRMVFGLLGRPSPKSREEESTNGGFPRETGDENGLVVSRDESPTDFHASEHFEDAHERL